MTKYVPARGSSQPPAFFLVKFSARSGAGMKLPVTRQPMAAHHLQPALWGRCLSGSHEPNDEVALERLLLCLEKQACSRLLTPATR